MHFWFLVQTHFLNVRPLILVMEKVTSNFGDGKGQTPNFGDGKSHLLFWWKGQTPNFGDGKSHTHNFGDGKSQTP